MSKIKKETVEKKVKLAPWDFINLMVSGTKYEEIEEKEQYSPFFIHRLVSSTDLYKPIINEINHFSSISKKISYQFIQALLPKRKMFFKNEVSVAKRVDQLKLAIQDYYSCGTRDVESHLLVLSEEVKEDILKSYLLKQENGNG